LRSDPQNSHNARNEGTGDQHQSPTTSAEEQRQQSRSWPWQWPRQVRKYERLYTKQQHQPQPSKRALVLNASTFVLDVVADVVVRWIVVRICATTAIVIVVVLGVDVHGVTIFMEFMEIRSQQIRIRIFGGLIKPNW
jgi:hypothetical protein